VLDFSSSPLRNESWIVRALLLSASRLTDLDLSFCALHAEALLVGAR
jgi:hypothetical protein